MRQVLRVILLTVTAWLVMAGVASAHETGGHSGGCAACVELPDASATEHLTLHDCHNGASCGAFVLPAVFNEASMPSWPVGLEKRMDDDAKARSAFLAQDLPPPRT